MTDRVRTVYAVSSGDYSDYSVHCLFETKELAQAYIDAYSAAERVVSENGGYAHDDMRIETFQLWSAVPHVEAKSEVLPERSWNGRGLAPTGGAWTHWNIKSEVNDHD